MTSSGFSLHAWLLALGQRLRRGLLGWGLAIFLAAQLLVLALSPSSYRRASRAALLREVYRAAGPGLPGFTALMALFNVVVIRIVVVTALAYGLTQYALDAVVRVLVLELIPLLAALFVAVEYTLPASSHLLALRRAGRLRALRAAGDDPLGQLVLPQVVAGVCAVLLLAAISCVVSLVLTYIAVHGFTRAGAASYHHAVGHIFSPGVSFIFGFKTLLFALAVALLPVASALRAPLQRAERNSIELQSLVRMFVLMLGIEIAALLGNYF